MRLTARIGKLERVERLRPPAPCPECGAPIGWVPGQRLVDHDGIDLGPTCLRCAFPLMSDGRAVRAVPPDGHQKRIILSRLPPG